ncbi:NAD(P)H-dependent oxidoreductase subunit E [bacterium]|nr:NAD(P)H-dependent oxidoreductase subunit E [bacterium]
MENQIRITVCCGTTCHLMGSSEILIYKKEIEERYNHQVVIYGSPCLGNCKEYAALNAPYVMIGEELICQANVSKVITYLNKVFDIKE